MDTKPTTSAAVLELAGAFDEVWNRSRDVLQALERVEAEIAEAGRRRAGLQAQAEVTASETRRQRAALAVLDQLRTDMGLEPSAAEASR